MKLSAIVLGVAGVAGVVSEMAGTVCVASTLRNQRVNEKAAKVALGSAGVSGAAAAVGYLLSFKECVDEIVDTTADAINEAVDNLEDDELFDEFNPEDDDFVEEELNEKAIDEIMNHEPVDRSQA